jgi:hypothetical protein
VGIVIHAETRFVEKHAQHYIRLYKEMGADVAKNWARTALQPEPRTRMIDRVNEILKEKRGE